MLPLLSRAAVPFLLGSSLPGGISPPTVEWAEWPMVAILLITIGVLFWRFERLIGNKDAQQEKQRETFAAVMKETTADHKEAMATVSGAMHDLSEGMRDGQREIIGRLAVHDATVAALTQALYTRGEIPPEKVEAILERIRRERI